MSACTTTPSFGNIIPLSDAIVRWPTVSDITITLSGGNGTTNICPTKCVRFVSDKLKDVFVSTKVDPDNKSLFSKGLVYGKKSYEKITLDAVCLLDLNIKKKKTGEVTQTFFLWSAKPKPPSTAKTGNPSPRKMLRGGSETKLNRKNVMVPLPIARMLES